MTPYETLTSGLAEMLADWHKGLSANAAWMPESKELLGQLILAVEDHLARAVVAEDEQDGLLSAQADTIRHYQGLMVAHFMDCEMEPGSQAIRDLVKAARSVGLGREQLGIKPAVGGGALAHSIYRELVKHRLDTMSQDSGQHCECRSDSRYAQGDYDGTWTDIDEHRATMVMKVLDMYGVVS